MHLPADRRLWAAALALYVVGDSVTTAAGLDAGLTEGNPAARDILAESGLEGMVATKLTIVAAAYGSYLLLRHVDRPRDARAVPLALVLLGTAATGLNGTALLATNLSLGARDGG